MARPLLPDELWRTIEPHLPPERPIPYGRRPVPHRQALTGILFVLRTGIPWEYLPQELGCGSGMTCWRRLRDWQAQGIWQKVHQTLLNALGDADQIDWSRAAIDAASVPAPRGPRNRAQSDGSRQIGHEAPWCGRSAGDSAGPYSLGGQYPGRQDEGSHRGGGG